MNERTIHTRAAQIVPGDRCFCGRPSRASTRHGLDRFCSVHHEVMSQHGSLSGSYSEPEQRPYRQLVGRWLRRHQDHPSVKAALAMIQRHYDRVGPNRTHQIKWMKPREKADMAWARVRDRGISPANILKTILAVLLLHRERPRTRTKEYLHVQLAKSVGRKRAYQERQWTQPDGRIYKERATERPRGEWLRHLGRQLEEILEVFPEAVLKEIRGDVSISNRYIQPRVPDRRRSTKAQRQPAKPPPPLLAPNYRPTMDPMPPW